ncbi:hypothetical protein HYDPIDRAFT_143669 [Hydnomerulius pinastri MD-312]|nr:hypothetical protein HYDPIDRAFT_143669 [Hydnomerulius pinastri MD-312]
MSHRAPRIHRLPQRLDYNLVPAPLDLSLPLVTEKSPLPAIIVTPSSPSLDAPEYYIAFLTPPPKPSLRERITKSPLFQSQFTFKARTAIIISLLFFILVCHLLAHLAVHRPHFDFYKSSDIPTMHSDSHTSSNSLWNLVNFDFRSLWGSAVSDERRSFIIEDLSQAAHR